MPQVVQAKKQGQKVSVEKRENSSFVFSLPEGLLPPQLTQLMIIPGDDLDTKIPKEQCSKLNALCRGINPTPSSKIDYIVITQPRESQTDFEIQLKTGIRLLSEERVRETVVAAIRDCEFDI